MDILSYNRVAWDRCVERGNRWTVPVSADDVAAVEQRFGGQLSVDKRLVAAAKVTNAIATAAFDFDARMLARNCVIDEYHLTVGRPADDALLAVEHLGLQVPGVVDETNLSHRQAL